jgi:hypothetical protein
MTDRYIRLVDELLEAERAKASLELYKRALESLYPWLEKELSEFRRDREEFEKTIEREIQEGKKPDKKIERLKHLKSLENEINIALIKLRTFIDLLKLTIDKLDLIAKEVVLSISKEEIDRLVTVAIQKIGEEVKRDMYEKTKHWDIQLALERLADEAQRISYIIGQSVEYLKKKE